MPVARTKVVEGSDNVLTCSAVVGKRSPVSLLNAGVVVRPSIVGRIAKVPLGARDTGSGVAPKTRKTMVIIIITGSEGLVVGRLGMVEHLR